MDVAFCLGTLSDCLRKGGIMLLTTPDGAWDDGDHPYNSNKRPMAVRAFKQDTLEAILRGGGPEFTINECHSLPYSQSYRADQGWIVAEVENSPTA